MPHCTAVFLLDPRFPSGSILKRDLHFISSDLLHRHGISFGETRRRISSCLSLPSIVPPRYVQECSPGNSIDAVTTEIQKNVVLAIYSAYVRTRVSSWLRTRCGRLVRLDARLVSLLPSGGRKKEQRYTCQRRSDSLLPGTMRAGSQRANSTSGQSHAQFRFETIDSSSRYTCVRTYTRTVLEQLKHRRGQTFRTVDWSRDANQRPGCSHCTRTIYMD